MTNTQLPISVELVMKAIQSIPFKWNSHSRFQHFFVLFVSALFLSCINERDIDPIGEKTTPSTRIQLLSSDSVWVYNDSTYKTILVQLNGTSRPDSVVMTIESDSIWVLFHLKDDGGFFTNSFTTYPWLSGNSGDIIPNDNIWSCRIAFGLLPIDTYTIKISSYQSQDSLRIIKNWRIVNNIAPILTSILVPDSVFSGIDTSIVVTTFDPDTLIASGIQSVTASFYQLPSQQFVSIRNFLPLGGNQSWLLLLPYTFASGKSTGNYQCVITSQDVLGSSISDSAQIWFENKPPICDSIQLAGSTVSGQTIVYFDSTGTDTVRFQFIVKWNDPQSETDLRSMRLRMYRNLSADTVIYDTTLIEGTGFDSIALDGRFLMPFQLDNRNRPSNPNYRRPPFDQYRIKFTAYDGGFNSSADTTFHFQIMQSPTLLSKKSHLIREKFNYLSMNPF